MWNGRNGKFIVHFLEHASSVKSGVFNFDGSRVLTASWDFNAKIWNRNKRDIQMDTSDCFFRIKRASIIADNFSFGQMPLGEVADTIIKPFIVNPNDFPFKIRSIKITGIASRDYTMLETHAPIEIDSMGRLNLELRFRPSNLGIRPARIEIDIPGRTYVLDLMGEGVQPSLSKSSPFINFGAVELNDYLDLMSNPVVTNHSIDPITIDSVRIEGPEREPFGFTGITYPVKLNPGDMLYSFNRFTPKYLHRTEGQLVFYHNGFGSPTKIPLFGEGIIRFTDTVNIYLDTITANAGEIINMPVLIKYLSSNDSSPGMAAVSFDLSFNPTILEPLGDNFSGIMLNDEARKIEVLANYQYPDTLLSLIQFKTGLGNDSNTVLVIDNISIVSSGKIKIYSSPGLVKIGDVCREGGARLINPGNRMFDISVNQIVSGDEDIKFGIESIEYGNTSIQLMDVIGNLKYNKSFVSEPISYNFSISSHDLPDGIYYLRVETPSISEIRKIIRLK
jgi:WD40 repeat protein